MIRMGTANEDDGKTRMDGRWHRIAFLRLGFRPFYLLAGLYALISIPLWIAIYSGYLAPAGYYPATLWHAHEMVYGYAIAVLVGFLFTAVPNWTGRLTPTGWSLALFALLWLAGRGVMFIKTLPAPLIALIDTAFLVCAGIALLIPLLKAKNYRNLGVVGIVFGLAASNSVFHLAILELVDYSAATALLLGLALVVLMMIIMGGRVIPAFTANALPGSTAQRNMRYETPAIVAAVVLVICIAFPVLHHFAPPLMIVTGGLNALRIKSWDTLSTLRTPILWILHVGYMWIIVGLLLAGASAFTPLIPRNAAIHALSTGAIASLTLGMMTRTALGHSGRPLKLSPSITWSYVMINLAALLRVSGVMLSPDLQKYSLLAAATAWALAFLIFIIVYLPIFFRARIDGKPG